MQLDCMRMHHCGVAAFREGDAELGQTAIEAARSFREGVAGLRARLDDSAGRERVEESLSRIGFYRILYSSLSDDALRVNSSFYVIPPRPPGPEFLCDEAEFERALQATLAEYLSQDEPDSGPTLPDLTLPDLTLPDLTLAEVTAKAIELARSDIGIGQPLSTGSVLAALARVDMGNEWQRLWLHSGEPGRIGLAKFPDEQGGTLAVSWADGPVTPAMEQSLTLLDRMCKTYNMAPASPGLLALSLVAYPDSGAARAISRTGLDHRQLLEIMQADLIGTHLEGLAGIIAGEPQSGGEPGLNPTGAASDAGDDDDLVPDRRNSVADMELLSILAAQEEAISIRRGLAETDPARFSIDLAASLENVSLTLSELDRQEEAIAAIEEAVGICRTLVKEDPASRAALASGLGTLAIRLSAVDRDREALAAEEECIELRRGLAAEDPRFREDLALVLFNVSLTHQWLNQRADALAAAEEATGLYRELAAEDPDYREKLAKCLDRVVKLRRGE
jgi:hypothetical protein